MQLPKSNIVKYVLSWILLLLTIGNRSLHTASGVPENDNSIQAEQNESGNSDKQAVIGTASSMVNIFPTTPPACQELEHILQFTSARNESESAQIVIISGSKSLTVDRFQVSDLIHSEEKTIISGESITVQLVGYTEIKESTWRGVKKLGLWPDPLLDFRPFVCPCQQCRALWVTIHVPIDAKAGLYQGFVQLFATNKMIQQIPVELVVWDFSLPPAPFLHTSYWSDFFSRYTFETELDVFEDMIRMFGRYRVSTNIWTPDAARWYREKNGSVTCDISGMIRNMELALSAGFKTLQVGSGCWAMAALDYHNIRDRETNQPLTEQQLSDYDSNIAAKLYMNKICDWLEDKKILNCSYMQIYDEAQEPSRWPAIIDYYQNTRKLDPRLRLLGLTGIHPQTQGAYDIWSPHMAFYDKITYDMVQKGISLYGEKNFSAIVSASSTGGWGNASFYTYRPIDSYDGCDYTKWIPAEKPTENQPQWLRFDFEQVQTIDGIRIVPYGQVDENIYCTCEGSPDGQTFTPMTLDKIAQDSFQFSFDSQECKAIRLIWTQAGNVFISTDNQPLPPPVSMTMGVCEIEFLRKGLPLESTLTRKHTAPSELWEYAVGADYPSVCIDADPAEIRSVGWQCWIRQLAGYLNYGAAQWNYGPLDRPTSEDPFNWPVLDGNGSGIIVYPGKDHVLPSIRFARFRDGVDDYDYLTLLEQQNANHPFLLKLRLLGSKAHHTTDNIRYNRNLIAEMMLKNVEKN